MSEPVIFKELPATFPATDKYRKPSVIGAVIFHGLLIVIVMIVPLLLPQAISQRELFTALVAPPAPPPAPPPPAVVTAAERSKSVKPQVQPVAPTVFVGPTVIPKDVAKIIDEPAVVPAVVADGVPGGVPGGVAGGVLDSLLTNSLNVSEPAPPPLPPPAPKVAAPAAPVRVGGAVREPRVVRLVPPVYPPLASRARVSGMVLLEATLTAAGTVDEIRVISGHPLLIEAAIDAVKQWQYEPTLLNGVPVAVILTAKVRFERPAS